MTRKRILLILVNILLILIMFLLYQNVIVKRVEGGTHIPTTNYIAETNTYTIKEQINDPILTNEEALAKYKEQQIGTVYVSSIDLEAPIVQGASNDDVDMQKTMNHTVGHEPESYLPGEGHQVILTGHREEQFGKLKNIKEGDLVVVNILNNQFLYEVSEIKVVLPEGDDAIEYVRGESDEDVLVMYTCYPFTPLSKVTNRYVVKAKRIPEKEYTKKEVDNFNEKK